MQQSLQKKKLFNINEIDLEKYLDEFRLRFQVNNHGFMRLYYLLRCMVSFSPFSRPTIYQIYEDFESILKEGSKPPSHSPSPNPGPNAKFNPQPNPTSLIELKFKVSLKTIILLF